MDLILLLVVNNMHIMNNTDIIIRLKELLDNEARSCSMDFGCVTPLYAYRMLGGQYSIQDIEKGLKDLKSQGAFGL